MRKLGRSQPARKNSAVRTLKTSIELYSARKKKAKLPPPYSTL